MRLQEVYKICREALEKWPVLEFDEVKTAGNTYYRMKAPNNVRDILAHLDSIIAFEELIATIRGRSAGFVQLSGDIIIDSRVKALLIPEYNRLQDRVSTIASLFESLDYRQESEGFDIKLPANMSLSDLSKCARDLDIVFSTCPLFAGTAGNITFTAVDVGSIWLSFVIGGVAIAATLGIVAELVDKALIIRSHYLTSKEQEEKIRSLKLGNEMLESAVSVNKTIGRGLMEKVSNELAEKHEISDPEDLARLKNSIQLLSDWMGKGMEIYPSIMAPPETKVVFPPIERQTLPETIVALLTDGNTEE